MKKTIIAIIVISLMSIIFIVLTFRGDARPPDSIFINDAVQIALQNDSISESVNILSDRLTHVFEDMDATRRNRDNALKVFLFIGVFIFAVVGILLCLYVERYFFMPFRKLQNFAHRIAAGNLDMPLEMDKHNLFGAFTESFDLMRVELRTARENEYKANQSKKELVASLSHDIKTPIASIMSAMDVMLVKAKDEKEKKMVESVNSKLEQINSLVTDMFHATLKELQVLKVSPKEIQSMEISTLIQNADYEERALSYTIPRGIILADPLRLQQVFDNIINNSYKYANTNISINTQIKEGFLVIDIKDFGSGVLEEEISLIFNKFYRGKNTGASEGYGLGLYIAKYFVEQMGGKLFCKNRTDGFTVTLMLKLAGNIKTN